MWCHARRRRPSSSSSSSSRCDHRVGATVPCTDVYLYPYFSPCDGTLDALDDVDDASCHQKLITRTADIYVLFFIPRGRGGSIARFHRVTGMKTVETSFKEKAKRHLLTHRTRRTFVFVIPHNTHTPHTHHTHTHTKYHGSFSSGTSARRRRRRRRRWWRCLGDCVGAWDDESGH